MKRLAGFLLSVLLVAEPAAAWQWGSGYDEGDIPADKVRTTTTNFNNNLSSTDTDVQAALETLDNMIASATPGGSNTQVQFNDGGTSFGGDSAMTYNKTTDVFSVTSVNATTGTLSLLAAKSSAGFTIEANNGTDIGLLGAGNSATGTWYGGHNFNAGLGTKNGSTSAGYVDLYEDSDNGSNRVRLIGPASTSDITLTLPNSAGTSGYFLQTDGSGNMSWAAGGGTVDGTGSAEKVAFWSDSNTLTYNDDVSIDADSVPSPPSSLTVTIDTTGTTYTQAGTTFSYSVYSFQHSVYSATGTSGSFVDTAINPSGGTSGFDYGGSAFTSNVYTYRVYSLAKSGTEESTGYASVSGSGTVPSPTDGTATINYGSGSYTADGKTIEYQIYAMFNSNTEFSPSYFQTTGVTDANDASSYTVDTPWTAVPGATGYRILRQINGGGFVDYRDVATNSLSDDNTGWSAGSTVTPAADYRQVVNWTQSSAVSAYRIFRDTGPGFNEYKDVGNVATMTDDNTGWNSGSPTAGGISFEADLSWTNMSVTSYRLLKTSTSEYQDTAGTTLTDDNTGWTSGSTVTPNVIDRLTNSGRTYFGDSLGIGQTALSNSWLNLAAGTTSKAPIVLTSGTNTTSVQNGAIEYNGSKYMVSTGGTRYKLPLFANSNFANQKLITSTGNDLLTETGGLTYNNSTGQFIVSSLIGNVGGNSLVDIRGGSSQTSPILTVANSGAAILFSVNAGGGITVNETSNDSDTRMESDGNSNMFFLDASTDRIGIANGAPDYTFDVTGSIRASTSLTSPIIATAGLAATGGTINGTRIGNSSATDATFTALAVNSGVGTFSITHGGSGYTLTTNDTFNVSAGGPVNFSTAVDINSGFIDGTKIGASSASDATFTSATVNDAAYAASWNGSNLVPTRNAVYDKIETLTGLPYWQRTLQSDSATLDDNSPPAIGIVESTGTGTARFGTADFDATTDEIIYWTFDVPSDMAAGNWFLDVSWFTNDTGAGETGCWGAAISATSEGDADTMAEQATDSINYACEDINTTEANRLIQTTITLSNIDSVAAGDVVTIAFRRDADSTNGTTDDLTSDARLVTARIRIPRS